MHENAIYVKILNYGMPDSIKKERSINVGLFDKVTKTASAVGKSTLNTASKVGSNVGVAAQDQSELASLKMQVNVIDQELDASYVQIGRKYVDYVIKSGEMPGIDISDLLKLMDPKMTQKQELQQQIIELEKKIKDSAVLREKQAVEEEFLKEKDKLDRALAMDVLSQADYEAKLISAKKKVENFEEIRRVEKQYDMKLISKEERDDRIQALTQ